MSKDPYKHERAKHLVNLQIMEKSWETFLDPLLARIAYNAKDGQVEEKRAELELLNEEVLDVIKKSKVFVESLELVAGKRKVPAFDNKEVFAKIIGTKAFKA